MTETAPEDHPSLDDVMGRDPLKLTKSDRAIIIAYYREKRGQFLKAGKPLKAPKAEKKPSVEIDLGDIDV